MWSAAAAAELRAASAWRCRLLVAVLALPLTAPLFLLYELLALPVLVLAGCAKARARRSRDERAGRRAEPCAAVEVPLLAVAVSTSLKVTALGGDWAWMPFWRLFTEAGRARCEYVDMAGAGRRGGGVLATTHCSASALPAKPAGSCRLVFISDTHGKHELVDVPAADVLCHSGDILVGWQNRACCSSSWCGRRRLASFDDWLGRECLSPWHA